MKFNLFFLTFLIISLKSMEKKDLFVLNKNNNIEKQQVILLPLKNDYQLRLKKKLFSNLYILYLLIIFITTYVFIIFVTFFFTGVNAGKYWSYLVPIVTIVNIYYLAEVKNNLFSKILIGLLIFFSLINYFRNKPSHLNKK